MNKLLYEFTQDECAVVSEKMFKHASIKWNSAKLLAENGDYGGAISSHIISMEEMIKGLIMFLDSKGFELRTIDGMDAIIRRSHSLRHFIGFVMFVINIFIDDFKKKLPKILKNPSILIELKDNKAKAGISVKWYLFRKAPILKKELYWFSQIEKFRQSGNHVDYDSQEKSPLEIIKKDYIEVYSRLNNVKYVVEELVKTYSDMDETLLEQVKFVQAEFKADNLYSLVGESLAKTAKKRDNPFDLMNKHFKK